MPTKTLPKNVFTDTEENCSFVVPGIRKEYSYTTRECTSGCGHRKIMTREQFDRIDPAYWEELGWIAKGLNCLHYVNFCESEDRTYMELCLEGYGSENNMFAMHRMNGLVKAICKSLDIPYIAPRPLNILESAEARKDP